jgi:amino acid transporter
MKTASSHLVRQIGLASGVAVVVGSTIGSGIFKTPSRIATSLPGPLPMLMVWVVGGLIVLCGALSLAEVGSAYPYSGGLYVYLREAYGRQIGFLFGWAQLMLLRPAGVGALAIVCGQYALRLFGLTDDSPNFAWYTAGFAFFAIALVTGANIAGVKFGTFIQNITTVAKSAGLLVLIVLALVLAGGSGGAHFMPAAPAGSFSFSAFGLALVSILWAYDGWADGTYVGGEMKDPSRTLPRAILIGTLAVIALYLLANVAYLMVFDVQQMGKSGMIAATAMEKLVGSWGVLFITATVVISTLGTLNGTVLTSPRVFFALAEDKLFFPSLASVHPKFKTPHVAVALCGALGASYVVVATFLTKSKAFEALTDAFVIGIVPFYALSVLSVFVFRRRHGGKPLVGEDSLPAEGEPHQYAPTTRVPLYPLLPVVFAAACAFLLGASLLDAGSRVPTLITLGVLVAGIPVYRLVFRRTA